MKIQCIEIYKADIPLKEPFRISLETVNTAQNLFVRIIDQNGLAGEGECSAFPSINGERQISQWALAPVLAKLWIGKSVDDPESRIKELDGLIAGNNNLKSAFDLALYDLMAKQAGLPLWKYLKGKIRDIKTDITVGLGSPLEMACKAEKYVHQGFKTIKVKLGGDPQEDIQRIQKIRQVIGDETALRVDANQGWDLNSALTVLQGIEPYHIGHCEEPIRHWDLLGQVKLTANSPISIMADESLFDHHDAKKLLDFKACHEFNIKLGKSGGFHQGLKIAEMALNNKIRCQVGCFMESKLAITALAHFVYASPAVCYFDMDSPLLLADDPVIGGLEYAKAGGIIINPDLPGTGAHIDPAFLKMCPNMIIS